MVAAFAVAVSAFEAVAVGEGGAVIGGFVLSVAGDPLEEFWHDGGAGAEDDGCELAHATGIVSMVDWQARSGCVETERYTHFHRPTLMIEYVSSEV